MTTQPSASPIGDRARAWVAEHPEPVPPPGHGSTWERLSLLMDLGRQDLALVKVLEAHLDALAILEEITGEAPSGADELWAVWAAEPPKPALEATRTDDGWRLDGTKVWCSGAHEVTHALLTARDGDAPRPFAVEMRQAGITVHPPQWASQGMAGSGTSAVDFDAVPATAVGDPASYLDRAGFWHGGLGVAACWWGGAQHLIDLLRTALEGKDQPHAAAHLGACLAWDATITRALRDAAREIDEDPTNHLAAQYRTVALRTMVDRACLDVIERFSRALGARPFAQDDEAAGVLADLQVYIRQSHAERDEASLVGLDRELRA